MIKKTELTTIIKMQCKQEEGDRPLAIIFCKDNNNETIQMGNDFQEAEKAEKYPFRLLVDAIKDICTSVSPSISDGNKPKAPSIKDHRSEQFAYVDESAKDPTNVLSENISGQANIIQNRVDETLNNMEESPDDFVSLTKNNSIQEASPDLDILNQVSEEDDPIKDTVGIDIKDIASRGPVPETPPEFKDQLKKIAIERTKTTKKNSEKRINRKE
jgi:hypothetical protein